MYYFFHIVDDIKINFHIFSRKLMEEVERFIHNSKISTTIHQIAFTMRPDSWNKHLRMSERTTWECVYKFAKVLIILYNGRYLHMPTSSDIHQLYTAHENNKYWLYAKWSKWANNNFRSNGVVWSLDMACNFYCIECQQTTSMF